MYSPLAVRGMNYIFLTWIYTQQIIYFPAFKCTCVFQFLSQRVCYTVVNDGQNDRPLLYISSVIRATTSNMCKSSSRNLLRVHHKEWRDVPSSIYVSFLDVLLIPFSSEYSVNIMHTVLYNIQWLNVELGYVYFLHSEYKVFTFFAFFTLLFYERDTHELRNWGAYKSIWRPAGSFFHGFSSV